MKKSSAIDGNSCRRQSFRYVVCRRLLRFISRSISFCCWCCCCSWDLLLIRNPGWIFWPIRNRLGLRQCCRPFFQLPRTAANGVSASQKQIKTFQKCVGTFLNNQRQCQHCHRRGNEGVRTTVSLPRSWISFWWPWSRKWWTLLALKSASATTGWRFSSPPRCRGRPSSPAGAGLLSGISAGTPRRRCSDSGSLILPAKRQTSSSSSSNLVKAWIKLTVMLIDLMRRGKWNVTSSKWWGTVTTATALADRTRDFRSISVVVRSVDKLRWSNCQNGDPNEEMTILNRFELQPALSCHFSMSRLTVSSRLRQWVFLKVPDGINDNQLNQLPL